MKSGNGHGKTAASGRRGNDRNEAAAPLLHQRAGELQKYGSVVRMPIGLDESVRQKSV